MANMFMHVLLSRYVHLLFLIVYFCSANKNKEEDDIRAFLNNLADKINRQLELHDICKEANLVFMAYPDGQKKTVSVFFKLSDSKFKHCFTYFYVILKKNRKTVDVVRLMYNRQEKLSHKFENIPCGIYEVVIRPYYTDLQPSHLELRFPRVMNISSDDCVNNFHESMHDMLEQSENIQREIILLIAVFSVISVVAVSAIVYLYYSKSFGNNFITVETEIDERDFNEVLVKSIHVYMFYYCSRKKTFMRRVESLRDFLEKTSCYKSVRVIEKEMHRILTFHNDWINEALAEKWKDGSIIKIIIISEPENEDEDHEVENYICTQAIKTLDSNKCRSLGGYDTLFIVKFRNTDAGCGAIEHFVRGARFTIPNHLVDLCLYLCKGSGLNLSAISEVKRDIEQLYLNHEIRYLGIRY